MTLHVFNPEHDIALASDLEHFTAPRAGRELRLSLDFLPALWADGGDSVLVADAAAARERLSAVALAARRVLDKDIAPGRVCWRGSADSLSDIDRVDPWGWDRSLRGWLRRKGVEVGALPCDSRLQDIRLLSHRRTSARLLEQLHGVGEGVQCVMPVECFTVAEAAAAVGRFGRAVVKAPWSSSGRGVRFVDHDSALAGGERHWSFDSLAGWVGNVVSRQGSVMVEPRYDKVVDFGMEFEALADGGVAYGGLSLFSVANGAYTGNILATEPTKRKLLGRYVAAAALDALASRLCRHLAAVLQGRYCGPLGVDMMVCRGVADNVKGMSEDCCCFVHPCVEINLRRTMGHVALSLAPEADGRQALMLVSRSGLQLRALS